MAGYGRRTIKWISKQFKIKTMRRIIDDLKMEEFTANEVVKYGVVFPIALFVIVALCSF